MSDFSDLVARAINPGMTRDERERVYAAVRLAVRRMQEQEAGDPCDARAGLQRHLVEETIRDIEGAIGRFLTMERMRRAEAQQKAERASAEDRRG